MSTDFAEKEREFLATLEADTGRSLAAWIAAITAQNFTDKNDVIDWLRQQGFMFSKASWLERIHGNGGRPIYGDAVSGTVAAPEVATPALAPPPGPAPIQTPLETQARPPVPEAPRDEALEQMLLKAKALQPLARFVLREIAKVVPGVALIAEAAYVSIRNPHEFAVLTISPRELKLGLTLAGEPFAAPLTPARFVAPGPRVSQAITHMAALTDARQIDATLLAAIIRAAAKANS